MLLDVLQCTEELPTSKNYLTQNVRSIQVEKFCLRSSWDKSLELLVSPPNKGMPDSFRVLKTGRGRMEERVRMMVLIYLRTWIQLCLKPVNGDSCANKSLFVIVPF